MIAKLSREPILPSVAHDAWSARIEQRYRCRLSSDLAAWFDTGIWKHTGLSEYHLAVNPESLTGDAPEAIWPALMPCDLLPLISNDAGDWLCVRLSDDSRASEVVQWYHGGGDWIPWGDSIAEAIVFDALRQRLPGPKRAHATPAELPRVGGHGAADDQRVAWACSQLPAEIQTLLRQDAPAEQTATALLESGICEVAVRCTLVEAALQEPLSDVLTHEVADELEVDWTTAIEWMFDNGRIPERFRERLCRQFNIDLNDDQDWETAAGHCRRVTQSSPDLSWAWDILGYCCERAGDSDGAINAYLRGAQASVFTDQSVRLRTHWTADQASKFSVARLLQLAPTVVHNSSYLRMLYEDEPAQRRRHATAHWLAACDDATAGGDVQSAHKYLVHAGWDLGAEPMAVYGDILQRIAETAVQAGRAAQAELADTHRACLKQRFGV